MKYNFTEGDVIAWKRNPYYNPITGRAIDVNAQHGVYMYLSKMWKRMKGGRVQDEIVACGGGGVHVKKLERSMQSIEQTNARIRELATGGSVNTGESNVKKVNVGSLQAIQVQPEQVRPQSVPMSVVSQTVPLQQTSEPKTKIHRTSKKQKTYASLIRIASLMDKILPDIKIVKFNFVKHPKSKKTGNNHIIAGQLKRYGYDGEADDKLLQYEYTISINNKGTSVMVSADQNKVFSATRSLSSLNMKEVITFVHVVKKQLTKHNCMVEFQLKNAKVDAREALKLQNLLIVTFQRMCR